MANPSRLEKIQITSNSNSGTATKVNVQEANGEVNTQTINTGFNKNIGLNSGDVVGADNLLNQYSTVPSNWVAQTYTLGSVVFYGGKQWIAKIATVAGDVPAVSSKWEEITFEALANKTVTVDQTIIDGSTNAVSSNAVFDGLATKAPIVHSHTVSQITDFPTFKTIEGQSVIGAGNIDLDKNSVGLGNVDNTSDLSKPLSTATINALATKAPISSVHNPVTIGTANGLSLSNQQLSIGLASSGVTGALSGTDWNTFNGKFPTPTGLTTNYLPKWNGSGFGNSQIFENGTNIGVGTTSPYNKFVIKDILTNGVAGSVTSFQIEDASGGNVSATGFLIKQTQNTGVGAYFTLGVNDSGNHLYDLAFEVNGAERVRILRNGNVGIGTPAPTEKLDVVGNGKFSGTISASPATTANQVVVKSQLDAVAARPYKVYTALLNQSGTNAPVATVLENTLGGTVVWSRTGVGTYVGTLSNTFATNKTVCFHQRSADSSSSSPYDFSISPAQGSSDTVDLKTTLGGGLGDNLLLRSSIEIRVYN